jgi:hypothetical protein
MGWAGRGGGVAGWTGAGMERDGDTNVDAGMGWDVRWNRMVRHGMVWHDMVLYGMIWYGMVWCGIDGMGWGEMG